LIPAEFDYVAPGSLDDALAALKEGGDEAKVLAGGHSLIPLMKLRLAAPALLVDLRRVEELRGIDRSDGVLRFGAMVRHHEVATGGYGLPSMAAATIADQQVRNMGTIGGTIAHGDPASDLPAILLAHEGSVTVRGSGGERDIAGADFFEDYLTTTLAEDEIVISVNLPALEGYGYGYEKFNRRQEDWAMVAVGALVKKGGDGTCADVRVGLTHMGSVPLRATAVEEALRGQPLNADTIAAASENAADGTEPPSDLNASQDYKRHLARVLCKRALTAASS
jgi:aerobic carbon-monoxide dehydrogenase medium subunit